jgi:CRP-like cAMP-binding protein
LAIAENHLIELLPRKQRVRLLKLCEPVELLSAEVLQVPLVPTGYAYFPVEGFISLVSMIENEPGLEVGMIGREGMLGAQLALGVGEAPLHAVVQGRGLARRITAKDLRSELAHSTALQRVLHRYLFVMMAQLAVSAACVRFHQIGPRLARWLLMSQDRAHADRFHVTQEFLAYMLGVRRVGVTSAALSLQRDGLIVYHRGEIIILNREALMTVACGCYASDCLTYAKLMA